MHENPRILHLLPDFIIGGTQTFVIGLSAGLAGRGYDSSLVGVLGGGPMLDRAHAQGIPARAMRSRNASEEFHTIGWLSPGALLHTRKILKEVQPDIVHCHLYSAALVGRVATVLRGVGKGRRPQIIESLHNSYEWKSFEPSALITDRILMRWTDRIVSPSRAVNDFSRIQLGVPASKQVIIHHGIDTHEFAPDASAGKAFRQRIGIEAGDYVVSTVGRMIGKKRQDVFLRAVAALPREIGGHAVTFVLVGNGPDELQTKALAHELGLEDSIVWINSCNEMSTVFNASDVLVQTADREGFGLALAEAMACGVPVISTRNGPAEEIITHNVSGLLVNRDDPPEVTAALLELLSEPERRADLGQAARDRIESAFAIESMLDNYDHLYRSLLSKSGK